MEERLQKILAHAGIASRRAAEKLIAEGRVRVNGHVVQEMGVRADPEHDRVTVDGKRVRTDSSPVHVLLNKPVNVLSTVDDPEGRPKAIDLVRPRIRGRVYPAGRLDYASEGLLILTNDGEFTRFMTQAGAVPKVYEVKVSGAPEEGALDRLRRGIQFEGVRYAPCRIEKIKSGANASAGNTWFEVTLRQGKNRQLRRMFEAIGHRVMRLRRTRIGFLDRTGLPLGAWRFLDGKEVKRFYTQYGGGDAAPETAKRPGRKKTVSKGRAAAGPGSPR